MNIQGHAGNSTADRASASASAVTMMDLSVPASCRGILLEWSVRLTLVAATLKCKIFRDDGTNYVFISEVTEAGVAGVNTFLCRMPIEKGDLIAIYTSNAAGGLDRADTTGTSAYKAGDITTTSLKTTWTAGVFLNSFCGEIRPRVVPL